MASKKPNQKKREIKVKLNNQSIKKVIGVFAGKLNKMLNENVNESLEIGTKKVGNTKVDYGIRMKFLDDEKNKESEFKFIKKVKKKK